MTQKELRAFYNEKLKLNDLILTLDGLKKIQESPPDTLTLEIVMENIQDLEAEIQDKTRELDRRAEDVAATLALLKEPMTRIPARLHFLHGMLWDEVSSIMNSPGRAIESRIIRAMNEVIPKG